MFTNRLLYFIPVLILYFRTMWLWKGTWTTVLVRPRKLCQFVCWSWLRRMASWKTNRSSSLSWISVIHGRAPNWDATHELLSLLQTSQVKEPTRLSHQYISPFAQKPEHQQLLIHILISLFSPSFPEPSAMMFKKSTHSFNTSDPTYTIPVVRTRNTDSPATVKWRTQKAKRFNLSGPLKFNPGELEKDIVIDPSAHPGPIQPESFQLELFDPSSNASVGEKNTTTVNVMNGKIQ